MRGLVGNAPKRTFGFSPETMLSGAMQVWTIVWFVWAFICALLPRMAIVALLRSRIGAAAYLVAYLGWPVLFGMGAVITQALHFDGYVFDRSDWRDWTGWLLAFFSPLGFPVLIGAPLVLVFDAATIVYRTWLARQTI